MDIIKKFFKSRKLKVILFFSVILLFYLVNNISWCSLNQFPVAGDEIIHLVTAYSYYNKLSAIIGSSFNLEVLTHHYWPPFFHIIAGLWILVFSPTYISLIMVNILFFLLLIICVYFISNYIANKRTGILAVIFLSLYPGIYGFSRVFMLDFALTAMVTFFISLLISTDTFNLKRIILIGIVFILGMLTKWSFAVFVIGPMLIFFTFHFKYLYRKDKRQKYITIGSILLILFILSFSWYNFPTLAKLFSKAKQYIFYPRIIDKTGAKSIFLQPILNLFKQIPFHLNLIIESYLSLTFFILFIVSLPFFLFRMKFNIKKYFLSLLIIPLIFFSIFYFTNSRNLLPILPFIAIISAYFSNKLFKYKIGKLLVCVFIIFGIFQYFMVSFVPGDMNFLKLPSIGNKKISIYEPIKIKASTKKKGDGIKLKVGSSPYKKDWKWGEIISSIINYNKRYRLSFPVRYIIFTERGKNTTVLFSNYTLMYYDILNQLKSRENREKFGNIIKPALLPHEGNYLVNITENNKWPTKGGSNIPLFADRVLFSENIKEYNKQYNKLFTSKDKFKLIKKIELPKNYNAYIYAKKIAHVDKGPLRLLADNGIYRINYNKLSLNEVKGMATSLVTKDKQYHSNKAIWEIEKVGKDKIVATGRWPDSSVSQVWQIRLLDKDEFEWKVKIVTEDKIEIKDMYAKLFLSHNYNKWANLSREGEYGIWDNTSNISGEVIGTYGKNIPGLVMDVISKGQLGDKLVVGKAESDKFIGVNRGKTSEPIILSSGSYDICKLRVKLFKDEKSVKKHLEDLLPHIKVSDNKLIYIEPEDRVRISYKDKIITTTPGIDYVIDIGGKSYGKDSWEKEGIDIDKDELKVRYKNKKVEGVELISTYSIEDEGIRWSLDIDTDKRIKVGKVQAGIFLDKGYRRWISLDKEGIFKGMELKSIFKNMVGLSGEEISSLTVRSISKDRIADELVVGNIERRRFTGINRGEGRIIELSKGEHGVSELQLRFCKNKNKMMSYLKEVLPHIKEGRYKILYRDGKIKVEFSGEEIGNWQIPATVINIGGKEYGAGEWKKEDVNVEDNRMKIEYRNKELEGVSLEEEFRIESGKIYYNVELVTDKKIKIGELQTGIYLDKRYDRWISYTGEGKYSNIDGLRSVSGEGIGVCTDKKDMIIGVGKIGKRLIANKLIVGNVEGRRFIGLNRGDEYRKKKIGPGKYKIGSLEIGRYRSVEKLKRYLRSLYPQVKKKKSRLLYTGEGIELRYKDKKVTTNTGIDYVIEIGGKEYGIGKWEKKELKRGKDKMSVIYKNKNRKGIYIEAELILEEKSLRYRLNILTKNSIEVGKVQAGIFLNKGYNKWLTLEGEGKYRKLEELRYIHRGALGVSDNKTLNMMVSKEGRSIADKLILGKVKDYKFVGVNRGKDRGKRKIEAGEYRICDIKIGQYSDYDKMYSKIRGNLKELSIGKKETKVHIDKDKKIQISYKEDRITEGEGIGVNFLLKHKRYSSSKGKWNITKTGKDSGRIEIRWKGIKGIIGIGVEGNKIEITGSKIKDKVKGSYRHNILIKLLGYYKELNVKGKEVKQIKLFKTERKELPWVLVKGGKSSEINHSAKHWREIRYNYIPEGEKIPKLEMYLYKGRDKAKERYLEEYKKHKKENIKQIREKDIKIKIRPGLIDIYSKGKNITAGLGLYSAIKAGERWYDYKEGVWDIEKEEDKIKVRVEWLNIPIVESWKFRIAGDKIEFTKEVKAYKDIDISQIQTNLMVDGRYNRWKVEGKKGKFSEEYKKKKYNMMFSNKGSKEVLLGSDELPDIDIGIESGSKRSKMMTMGFNTIESDKNRVIQYQMFPGELWNKEKKVGFKGKLRIKE